MLKRQFVVLIIGFLILGLLNVHTQVSSAQSNSYVATQSQGWRMGGGNPTNSYWNAAETNLYPPLKRVWSWSASNERFLADSITYIPYGAPNGIVYVSGMGIDNKNVVYAIDVYANQSRWRYQLLEGGGAMSHHVAVTWPYAVFGGQGDDYLYIVDAANGTTLSLIPGFSSLYTKSAKIADNMIFACGNEVCKAINLSTQNIIWSQNMGRGSAQSDLAIVYNTLVGRTPANYPGSDITLFNKSTGQILLQTGLTRGHSIVTDGNNIYSVQASYKSDGSISSFSGITSTPFTPSSSSLHSIDDYDFGFWAHLAVTDTNLYVAGSNSDAPKNALVKMRTSPWGVDKWVDLPQPAWAMAVANNIVYVGTETNLYAYNAQTLSLLWAEKIRVSDIAIADGFLFVVNSSGVYAFRTDNS